MQLCNGAPRMQSSTCQARSYKKYYVFIYFILYVKIIICMTISLIQLYYSVSLNIFNVIHTYAVRCQSSTNKKYVKNLKINKIRQNCGSVGGFFSQIVCVFFVL